MSILQINIDDLIGVRYKENGRDKKGFDCYGYAMEVEKRFGYELPEIALDAKFRKQEIREELLNKLNIVEINKATNPSDLLLINDNKGIFSHIGVYLGNGKFTHCNIYGVHINNIKEYENRIGKVYKWQE